MRPAQSNPPAGCDADCRSTTSSLLSAANFPALERFLAMLESMRAHLTGWPVKIMLGLLIVAFAVWGIGDVFRGGLGGDAVAEVGGLEVSSMEVRRAFESNYRELQQRTGNTIDRRQAVQFGLMQQSLQELVGERLVAAHARDLAITVPDTALSAQVRDDPLFRSAGGFDRDRVELVARSQGMTEDTLLESIRADLVRRELIRTLTDPVVAPELLARELWHHGNETRIGRALVVLADRIPIAAPDDAALTAYLEQNKSRWQRPELRDLTIVQLRPADLADEVGVDEADIRAEYDSRIGEFREPERREVAQLLAADEATAKEAADLVAAGRTFAGVAELLAERGVTTEALGAMTREQLPGPLGDAVFGLAVGEVSPPVSSGFGWHLFRLDAILPEATRPLEAVRAQLAEELRLRAAADRLPDLANTLEDAIAGGASLEEAATQAGVEPSSLATIDRAGNDSEGRPFADQVAPEILPVAFETGLGEISPLGETADGGYFAVRVDAIKPAATRDLADIREPLTGAWTAEQQLQQARSVAEELRKRAAAGESLDALQQASPGTALRAIGPVRRGAAGQSPELTPAAVAALFERAPGEVAESVVELPDGIGVIATDSVDRGQPPPDLGPVRDQLAGGLRSDILEQYVNALRQRYAPTVNDRLLDSLLRIEEG